MNFNAFLERIRNLLLFPAYEWKVISLEDRTVREDLYHYAFRLILPGAIAQFLGSFFYIQHQIDIDAYRFSFPLTQAAFYIIIQLLTIVLSAYFVTGMARKFKSTRNFARSLKLVIYSFTPFLLMYIVANLNPILLIALLPGAYGLVLFGKGLPEMLQTVPDKRPAFIIIFLISVSGIMFLLSIFFKALTVLIFPGVLA